MARRVLPREAYGDSREIRLDGKPVRYLVPRHGVDDGNVYLTEDRKLDGFFETMSIAQNIWMGDLANGANPASIVTKAKTRKLAAEWTRKLPIRAINTSAKKLGLSGGNQQKVVIAKSLVQKPRLIIFDESTRGVDVGLIVEIIHQIINELANSGIAVVLLSSLPPRNSCARAGSWSPARGRSSGEMNAAGATEERIVFCRDALAPRLRLARSTE